MVCKCLSSIYRPKIKIKTNKKIYRLTTDFDLTSFVCIMWRLSSIFLILSSNGNGGLPTLFVVGFLFVIDSFNVC